MNRMKVNRWRNEVMKQEAIQCIKEATGVEVMKSKMPVAGGVRCVQNF